MLLVRNSKSQRIFLLFGEDLSQDNYFLWVYLPFVSGFDRYELHLTKAFLRSSRLRLRPRMLRNVETRDKTVTLLGSQKLSMPIGISPTGFQKFAHPEGEKATARGVFRRPLEFAIQTLPHIYANQLT